ncbi:MAG: Maf family protein [Planctomycetota bacterium]
MSGRQLYLASTSPRRRQLLTEAGYEFEIAPPRVDDGQLHPQTTRPTDWVMALAWMKARSAADALRVQGIELGIVLAADTVCAHDCEILGQPRDRDDAERMLRRMRDSAHITMTGVALAPLDHPGRLIAIDQAEVHVGAIHDDEIVSYLDSNAWIGKAGAYNLDERRAAGWAIECVGDPTTVMGLPMNRLDGWLRRVSVANGVSS